jgi:DNA transformation protein
MFAVIAGNELYLRATPDLEPVFRERGMVSMIYSKRGAPVALRYYWVNESMWQDRQELFALAWQAMRAARKELQDKKYGDERLRDLPNIDIGMERSLWQAGIRGVYDLRLFGARRSYLKLLQQQNHLGLKALLALAGAISGFHEAALPTELREDLTEWFEMRTRRAAKNETARQWIPMVN